MYFSVNISMNNMMFPTVKSIHYRFKTLFFKSQYSLLMSNKRSSSDSLIYKYVKCEYFFVEIIPKTLRYSLFWLKFIFVIIIFPNTKINLNSYYILCIS